MGHNFFFSELCWGKAMVAYTMTQQRKKEESERLRGERDQIKFIDLGFERWQLAHYAIIKGHPLDTSTLTKPDMEEPHIVKHQ